MERYSSAPAVSQIYSLTLVRWTPGGSTTSIFYIKAAASVFDYIAKVLLMYRSTMHVFPTELLPMMQILKGTALRPVSLSLTPLAI